MQAPVVYPANRIKQGVVFLGCCAFVALGCFLIPTNPVVGWACTLLFGAGAALALCGLALAERIHLKLTPDGFEMVSLFGKQRIRWGDVERFAVGRIRHTRGLSNQLCN